MRTKQQRDKEKRYQERQQQKNLRDGIVTALMAMQVLPAYILDTRFQFTNEQIQKFQEEFVRLYNEVFVNQNVSLQVIADSVEIDTGIRYDLHTGEVFNSKQTNA